MSKTAKRYLAYKQTVGWAAKAEKIQILHTDVHVVARAHLYLGSRDMDVDNLGKSVLDSLNGIAWVDDRQVTKLTVEKLFVPKSGKEMMDIEIQSVS
jgi:Holliday junction resolvase RusA-like endonuclease